MTRPLDEAQLAELERLSARATPAPWSVVDPPWRSTDDMPWIVRGDGDPHGAEPICDLAIQGDSEDGGGYNAEDDARFIAAARSALPSLLAEVRASRAAPQEAERVRTLINACLEPMEVLAVHAPVNLRREVQRVADNLGEAVRALAASAVPAPTNTTETK